MQSNFHLSCMKCLVRQLLFSRHAIDLYLLGTWFESRSLVGYLD